MVWSLTILEKVINPCPVQMDTSCCLRHRHKASSCRRCADACPAAAVSLREGKGVFLDRDRCTGCGLCVNLCPTEAFTWKRLRQDLRSRAGERSGPMVVGCHLGGHDRGSAGGVEMVVPCLGALDEGILAGLLAQRGAEVWFDDTGCSSCNISGGREIARRTAGLVNRLATAFGLPGKVILGYPGEDRKVPAEGVGYTRRELFSFLGKKGRERVAGLLDGMEPVGDEKAGLKSRIPPKRAMLLRVLRQHGTPSGSRQQCEEALFNTLNLSPACNGCGECAFFCPTGALAIEEDPSYQRMTFALSSCLGCGLCKEVCPLGVVQISPAFVLQEVLEDGRRTLVEHPRRRCNSCDRFVVGKEETVEKEVLCSSCQKEKDLARSFLTMVLT